MIVVGRIFTAILIAAFFITISGAEENKSVRELEKRAVEFYEAAILVDQLHMWGMHDREQTFRDKNRAFYKLVDKPQERSLEFFNIKAVLLVDGNLARTTAIIKINTKFKENIFCHSINWILKENIWRWWTMDMFDGRCLE